MSQWEDRRIERRVPVPANRLQIRHSGQGQPLGSLANLSRHGLMLNSPGPLPADTTYQVRLSWDDESARPQQLALGITVLWCEAGAGGAHWSGCQIIAISDADQARLDALVSQLAA